MLSSSCAPFQDSPYSDQLLRSERELNLLAKSKLDDIESDGTIKIAVITDSHQNYKSLDQVIHSINRQAQIDFVAHLGDFSNSGYNIEYNQFLHAIVRVVYPTFVAIGNHDAVGAGPSLFTKAFGPSNFWFESSTKRYIFFNTANWEDPKAFSPQWLKDTIEESTKSVIIFTHVSLRDTERFEGSTAQMFDEVINHPKVQLILNGHNHVYQLSSDNGTILLQGPRVQDQQWLLLNIQGTQLSIQKMHTGEVLSVSLKP